MTQKDHKVVYLGFDLLCLFQGSF